MAYYDYIVKRALIRAGYRCEACGRYWYELDYGEGVVPLHIHSAISFHVVRNKKTGLYRATSVPPAHKKMKGRILKPNKYIIQRLGRDDDGYCLCLECHRKVHAIATDLTNGRFTTGDSKNAIPYVLEMVTISFILNRGVWIS